MKLGIMQPYFLPYIGYWQLMNSVDEFIIYDDVNYIKRGWINRNKILLENKEHLITIPLKKASQNKLINEIEILQNEKEFKKIYKTFKHAYNKAPYFNEINPIIKEILFNDNNNLASYLYYSIKLIKDYLNINTKIYRASKIEYDKSKKGQFKILEIVKIKKADHYINPIGGIELYDKKIFEKEGIKLNFIKTADIKYKQFNNEFIPNLSIIDVMMFNSKEEIKDMLEKYTLI